MAGLVTKCVAAPKAKTKDLAAQIALMFIEIEKQEIAMEELLKGTEQKNPKIVSGCINIMTQAIRLEKKCLFIYICFYINDFITLICITSFSLLDVQINNCLYQKSVIMCLII